MANRSATDIYPTLVRGFRLQSPEERPDFARVFRTTGIDIRTAKRAWDVGYPPTRKHERFPAIRVLFEGKLPPAALESYLGQVETEPAPKPDAPSPEERRATAAVGKLITESAQTGLGALLGAPPPAHVSPPPAAPAPATKQTTVVYVGSDAAERKAVDTARHGAAGLASIAIQILAGAEPYAKAVRARMEQAAASATVEDSKFVLTTLDDLSKILERSANAIAKLSAVTSVLDGRAHEIHRHETAPAPAAKTPAEIAAVARAVLSEVRLWTAEREAPIDVTPAPALASTDTTPTQNTEGASSAATPAP